MKPEHELDVEVKYSAATRPYKQEDVPRTETVGDLLAAVLQAFGLTPGQTLYTLRYEGKVLENMQETLGHLAGNKHHLLFMLGQQLVAGHSNDAI
jgi:hypothetical protein